MQPLVFEARAGRAGVTHISGTPTHWRKALMGGEAGRIAPDYVRLSGEIADDSVLQSQPIEFKLMDHDVYTTDAV